MIDREKYLDKSALNGAMEPDDELVWLTLSVSEPTPWSDVLAEYCDTQYKYNHSVSSTVDMILKLNFKLVYRDYINAYTGEFNASLYEVETKDIERADGSTQTYEIRTLKDPSSFDDMKSRYTGLYDFATRYALNIGIYLPSRYIRKDLLRSNKKIKTKEKAPKSTPKPTPKQPDLNDLFSYMSRKLDALVNKYGNDPAYEDTPSTKLYKLIVNDMVDSVVKDKGFTLNEVAEYMDIINRTPQSYATYRKKYAATEKIVPAVTRNYLGWTGTAALSRAKATATQATKSTSTSPAATLEVVESAEDTADNCARQQVFANILETGDESLNSIHFLYTNPHMLKVQEDSLEESKYIVERGKIYFQREDIRLYHYPITTKKQPVEFYVDEVSDISWLSNTRGASSFTAQLVVSDDVQPMFNVGDAVHLEVKGKPVFYGIIKTLNIQQATNSFRIALGGLDLFHTVFMSETVMSGISMLKNTESDNAEDQARRFVLSAPSGNMNPALKPLDQELIQRFAYADTMFFNSGHQFVVPQVLTDFIDRVLIFPRQFNTQGGGKLEASALMYKDTDTNLLVRSYFSESFTRFGCSCYEYIHRLAPLPFIEMFADVYAPFDNAKGEAKTQKQLIDAILRKHSKANFVHPDDPVMQPFEPTEKTLDDGTKVKSSSGRHKEACHNPYAPLHIITRFAPITNLELTELPYVTVHNSLISSIAIANSASDAYSAFQVLPDIGLGAAQMDQAVYMPPIVIPELAELFGLRLLAVNSPFNTLQPGLVQPASFYWAHRDLERIMRGMAFTPFMEAGTITIPAHDAVKAGMALHVVDEFGDTDPYIAYITSVRQSRSARLNNCTTTISFIRGCTLTGHNAADCAFDFKYKTLANDTNSDLESVKFDAGTLTRFIDKEFTYHTKFHNLFVKTGKYDV